MKREKTHEGEDLTLREEVTVHLPPEHLADRAACLVLRRVEGRAGQALHSLVHANPHACLNLVLAGSASCDGATLPRQFLCGPLSAPLATAADAGLVSCSLVFPPWLLAPVFGCDAAAMVDRVHALPSLPQPLHAAFAGVLSAPAGIARLWTAWEALSRAHVRPDLAFELLRDEGVAAAGAWLGCSVRQYRRRFQARMGLAPAVWARLARWEQAARGLAQPPSQALADVALAAGYADQAHLTRETRVLAGAPPARLRRAVAAREGPWSLAPARVRFVQDAGDP